MELVVIRHADAAPAPEGGDDARRPLTRHGRKVSKHVAQGLERMGIALDRIYYSPLLRAIQTAEIVRERLGGEGHVTPGLAEAPSRELLDQLDGGTVALVGHEPYLGALLAWLVSGDRNDGERFALRKGSVALLEGVPAPKQMTLRALLPPDSL